MQIVELLACHVRIPLKTAIRHASHARRLTDSILVRCRLSDGSEGWGEGLPRPYVTGETIESAMGQLEVTDLAAQLDGRISGLDDAIDVCTRLRLSDDVPHPAEATVPRRDCFGHAARCAIELSVLDAVCRSEDVSLSEVTRRVPEIAAIRATSQQVQYSAAFTTMSPLKVWWRGRVVRRYGFHQAKVKIGTEGFDDVAFLRRVRRAVGRNIDLRIDVNEAWPADGWLERLEPLVAFGISSVEQPVSHAAVASLAGTRETVPVPVMLDESLCSPGDARAAIDSGSCQLFNIRLSKCGGMLASLRLAAMAHQAGLGWQLGCQIGETGILSAAGRHVATSVGGWKYLEGSYDRHLVREALTVEDLTFGHGGFAGALDGPGLGITVDVEAVERVTITRRRFDLRATGVPR